jgi:hypothetical protein
MASAGARWARGMPWPRLLADFALLVCVRGKGFLKGEAKILWPRESSASAAGTARIQGFLNDLPLYLYLLSILGRFKGFLGKYFKFSWGRKVRAFAL